jgi:hypothetical protein
MGGQREDVLQGEETLKPESGKPKAITVQKHFLKSELQEICIHESKGQVHFHADKDKDKLKVAVPVAKFWEAWAKLKSGELEQWLYADADNETMVTIATMINVVPADVKVSVTKRLFGKTSKQLEKFVSGK